MREMEGYENLERERERAESETTEEISNLTLLKAVWDSEYQGGSSGLSRVPSWCVLWSIPTKTPVDFSQFLGRFSSF